MANVDNYNGDINIKDPKLFNSITDLTQLEVYSKKNTTRDKMDGQVVANEVFRIGDFSAIPELTAGDVADNDIIPIRDVSTGLNKFIQKSALAGGAGISTYSLLGGTLTVTGTAGITATKVGGVITVIVPATGALSGGSFTFATADAIYSSGTLTNNAIKIVIDNTANSTTEAMHRRPVQVYSKTNTTIGINDPATFNTNLTFNTLIEQDGGGITSFAVREVPSNATAGGFIIF